MSNNLQDTVLAFGITGVALTAALLLSIAYVAWNPVTRPHPDCLCARWYQTPLSVVVSSLIFAASFIPVFPGPSAGCSFLAFFGVTSLMFSACMFFCIALNLQLVVVHRVNGNMMEKYYYIGSVMFVAICNITPYAAGQYGYYNGDCWFNNPDPEVQFRWLVGSQSVWSLLMSTGEVVSFFVILAYMLRVQYKIRSIQWSNVLSSERSNPPVVAYRSTIIRIGLCPLLSCCLSFTGSILDIWLAKSPVTNLSRLDLFCEQQWKLSLDLCVYGLRPILYTLIAAGDPSFVRAIGALRNQGKTTHSTTDPAFTSTVRYAATSSDSMRRFSMNTGRAVVHVQLEQVKQSITWGPGGGGLFAKQSNGSKVFEERNAVNQSDAGTAKGKPGLVEQEQEPESGLREVVCEREREREEELDVEAQTRTRAEDIVQQM
ncbi:hypothetical protein B0H16DRAFT_1583290 [Mycena metata]|uniref:G-protein coupled receptors family 2 profile 2 domain-containing protein n=1 Tax=Mycena metata TaxID=1033252 RepID=A0AAD7I0T7_9AGAR|nr:hypothetical protein B0H16DRAFT_1583290 [Mycena metata]